MLGAQIEALEASADWQSVLAHFDFHEGFAFGLLLLPGSGLATACRLDLERHLAISGKRLLDLSPTSPEDLLTSSLSLASHRIGPEIGCIWIAAVISEYQADFPAWSAAFQNAFARLNPVRNVLQRHLPCTLLFVGAPWTQAVIRSMAPDLWSVRSLVTSVASIPLSLSSRAPLPSTSSAAPESAPDPDFALGEAASLRGKPGQEAALLRLLDRAGSGFMDQFRFHEARMVYQEALDLRRQLGSPDFEIALAELNLARSLIEPGHFAAGTPHLETALQQFAAGKDHESARYLAALNLAATLLIQLGRLQAARELQERIVPEAQRQLGAEDPNTLDYLSNLAYTIYELGEFSRAREMQEQIVAASRRVLGPEHELTLSVMNNLGSTLWRQHDLAGARSLAENVLEARTRVLGPEHPDTLIAMNNLATIVGDSGDVAGAVALTEQVLERLTRALGPEHPSSLLAKGNLAYYLSRQGDLVRARKLYEETIATQKALLGPNHRDTLSMMSGFANTLWQQEDLSAARSLEEEVLEQRRRNGGSENKDTITAMRNLAFTLESLGDQSRADALRQEAERAEQALRPL